MAYFDDTKLALSFSDEDNQHLFYDYPLHWLILLQALVCYITLFLIISDTKENIEC